MCIHIWPWVLDLPNGTEYRWHYFINIADIIRNEFKIKAEMDSENGNIAEMIQNSQSVSIHIRRGDYITNPKAIQKHGVCGLDYYNRCAEQISLKIKSPRFFVFSNDFDWSRKNIKLPNDAIYIGHNGPNEAYKDLQLMSFCKYHITANSTFSWWGAWLAAYKDKIVFVPKKWFAKDMNTEGMMPDNWIKV